MTRHRHLPVIGASVLILVVFVCVPLLKAQGLPNGLPDNSGAFGSAGPSDLLNGYYAASTSWISLLQSTAQTLFWALAAIDLTWTCITLVLQHSELQPWMAGFIRKILTIGFFATLLQNGVTWTTDIVNFFINLGSTAGGRSVAQLSASQIMGNGVELAGKMLAGAASAASNTNTSPIGLLIGGVGSFAPTIILAIGSVIIMLAFVMIALHFVMAMVEAYVVVGAGYIFLGFGGSRWTVPYTEKYMGMVIAAGVRIMVLELVIGMGSTLLPQWKAIAIAISRVPDIFSGGTVGSTWSGVQAEFGLVSSILIFALLCWTIPQIAANVASGGLSMSGGDALNTASAAGTAAFAGASWASSSSPAYAGSAEAVQQVAQAAAMRGAEIGIAATTGGTGAGAMSAWEATASTRGNVGSEAAAAALTPEPPPDPEANVSGEQVLPPGGDIGGASAQQADASLAQADRNTESDAIRANEAPGIDQAQEGAQDVVRNAGTAARLEALAKGYSPQQAIWAERDAKAEARSALSQARQVVGGLDAALRRLPATGGRIEGITPDMRHGDH